LVAVSPPAIEECLFLLELGRKGHRKPADEEELEGCLDPEDCLILLEMDEVEAMVWDRLRPEVEEGLALIDSGDDGAGPDSAML
jgi:hypothetical protein